MVTDRRGIGLISVIVAIGILAVAMTMMVSVFIGGSKAVRSAANLATAGNYAEGILERTVSKPFDKLVNENISSGLPELPGAECSVTVNPAGSRLKEVTVTLTWREGEQDKRVRFSTLAAGGAR